MPIFVLDPHTAELIAAGEVVERPSSVVKELVENALDAGAKSITVEIEKGGIQLMRVQDDGAGIPPEDIPLAFLRHATSKVRTEADLEAIATLGFRGEALASIASVAQVELLSKTGEDEFASLYTIAGGQEKGIQPAARPLGTTVTVKNLFYNTPARMKFLKKDTSEGTFVAETVTRLALSHPEVALRFVREGKPIFATPGDGDLQSAAYAVLGAEFARDLVEVKDTDGSYKVHGLITPPRALRGSRAMQFFYINGRFVKNRTVMAALEQAYRGMAMQGKFPGGILFIDMPHALVDVNVHPAKTEVRFAKERDVFDAVYAAVKSALLGQDALHRSFAFASQKAGEPAPPMAPVSGLGTAPLPPMNPVRAQADALPQSAVSQGSPPVGNAPGETFAGTLSSESFAPYTTARPTAMPLVSSGFTPPPAAPPQQSEAVRQTSLLPESEAARVPLRVVGEVFKTYIVAEYGDTLCLLDKHAAHERIIYEGLAATRGGSDIQQLVSPVAVTLSAAEKEAVLQNLPALLAAGMEMEDFGGASVLVRGVPADIPPANVQDMVVETAQRMMLNPKDTDTEKTQWVLHSVACRAALKAGDNTPLLQLLQLAEDILCGSVPPFCPHGRPVVLEIPRKELEKQFGRLG